MNSFENLELNYLNWTKWVKQVNNFICAQGIDTTQSNARCKAILLHYAGTKINEIFDTLSEDGDDYQVTIDKISAYLKPRKNVAFDRYNFREIAQNQGELMKDYIIRLRLAGATCELSRFRLWCHLRWFLKLFYEVCFYFHQIANAFSFQNMYKFIQKD